MPKGANPAFVLVLVSAGLVLLWSFYLAVGPACI